MLYVKIISIKKIKYYYIPKRMSKIQMHWQHQMLVRMWSNRNSHSLLLGLQNGTAILEQSLVVSYETEHILTIQSVSVYSQMNLKLFPCKNLHMNIYSRKEKEKEEEEGAEKGRMGKEGE